MQPTPTADFLNAVHASKKAREEAQKAQEDLSKMANRISRTAEKFFEQNEQEAQIRRVTGTIYLLEGVVATLVKGGTRAHIMLLPGDPEMVSKLEGIYKTVFEKLTDLKVDPFIDEVKDKDAPNGAHWYISMHASEEMVAHLWDLYRQAVKNGTEPSLVD